MNDINDIASKHLGRASDGTIVQAYVTPDVIDPTLLVGVPRILNRTQYEIDENNLPFVGTDTWNCYEFSTLLDNGYPLSGVLRIVYPSNSMNIVESKSLKLYLNSFNMYRSGSTLEEAVLKVEERIARELTAVIGANVEAVLHTNSVPSKAPFLIEFTKLEDIVSVGRLQFNSYNEDPNILQVVDQSRDFSAPGFTTNALRSNCRVTNQPDWGDVFIHYTGPLSVTPESLLQYIVSMRRENHFHEEICECIYKRLDDALKPTSLFVSCLYTRRGGIDINPLRASSLAVLLGIGGNLATPYVLNHKTMRQ